MAEMNRDTREIIRDEMLMRAKILDLVKDGPMTVPEIAGALICPTHEVMYWVMGMRKYGQLAEEEVTDEGYFKYRAAAGEES